MSCSYGPGRYDSAYEKEGHDYLIGFVRWTEQRNFQAVIHALATGVLRTPPSDFPSLPHRSSCRAYDLLSSPGLPWHPAAISRYC